MYHPDYAWMFFNWYSATWWMGDSKCSVKDLERVIERSIVFDHYPRIEEDQTDIPNIGKIVSTANDL